MLRINIIMLLISFQCAGQSNTVNRNDVDTANKGMFGVSVNDAGSNCGAITGLPFFYYLADTLSVDIGMHWQYDKTLKVFKTDSSFIHRLSKKYYGLFLGVDKYEAVKYLSKGMNPVIREKMVKRKGGVVAYTTYPVVCNDCNFERQSEPCYVLFYNKRGEVVRHGLEFLKNGKIPQTH